MYNLVVIQTVKTAEEPIRDMRSYETLDDVNAAMFYELSYSSAKGSPVNRCICSILDDNNIMIKRIEWKREIIEAPEPQTENEQTEEE